MKYLIQNRKEFVITIGVFLTFAVIAFWCIWDIIHNNFSMANLAAIFAAVVEYFGWYFNQPTSEENSRYTGLMRLEKAQKDMDGVIGENFFDEPEDVEEVEDDE